MAVRDEARYRDSMTMHCGAFEDNRAKRSRRSKDTLKCLLRNE